MRLFISSFDEKLLKSLIISFIVFFIYSFALKEISPNITTFQNQWVKNYSIGEKYIYEQNPGESVIVGSSMAAMLPINALSNDVYNLSFAGGSALTGLSIIKQSGIMPKAIFIETNIIENQLNNDMLESLFTPIIWKIKKIAVSLRYTYQPINIILTLISNKFSRSEKDIMNEKPDIKKLHFGLAMHLKEMNKSEGLVDNEMLAILKNNVNDFEKQGVKVVFFQMPVDKSILSSKRYLLRKSILSKMFPNADFYWLPPNEAEKYQTSDGIHLLKSSALQYSSVLNKIIAG